MRSNNLWALFNWNLGDLIFFREICIFFNLYTVTSERNSVLLKIKIKLWIWRIIKQSAVSIDSIRLAKSNAAVWFASNVHYVDSKTATCTYYLASSPFICTWKNVVDAMNSLRNENESKLLLFLVIKLKEKCNIKTCILHSNNTRMLLSWK